MTPHLQAWQWALGAVCAVFVGVAKTGMPGFGISAIPLMVFTVGDARASAGWLLPILCVADLFAIAYYRRHAYARRLFDLAPWVLLWGWSAGCSHSASARSRLRRWWGPSCSDAGRSLGPPATPDRPVPADWHHGARYGLAAGFATTVANAAGPVMNVYLLSKRLPKEEFIAAGAWFFFLVNLSKLPLYGKLGMISTQSLLFDACMLPAVAAGAVLGRGVMKRLPQHVFEKMVLGLATASALLLFIRG